MLTSAGRAGRLRPGSVGRVLGVAGVERAGVIHMGGAVSGTQEGGL